VFIIVDFFCLHASSNVSLPPPPPSFSLDKEVTANKEGIDDNDANAVTLTATNDAAPDDDDYATMPTTVSLLQQRGSPPRRISPLPLRSLLPPPLPPPPQPPSPSMQQTPSRITMPEAV
jgi:hypothetical protein